MKALPETASSQLEKLKGDIEIVVGIPSYNNAGTIGYVAETAAEGLLKYFDGKGVILNSDGGSTDGTKEAFISARTDGIEKLAFNYRGVPGKGSALKALMEAAVLLEAKALVFLDSDLKSVRPWWVKSLATPILEGRAAFVTPYYKRHKYDGTITNHICYPLTSVLYGYRVRQPIGGDFGVSYHTLQTYLSKPEDVWRTDVARFGIDIWMTTVAIVEGDKPVFQAALGAKVHDVKDPGKHLGPMFSQVVSTLFLLMQEYASVWKNKRNAIEDVPIYGSLEEVTVEPVAVDLENLKERARKGMETHWWFVERYLTDLKAELERAKKEGSVEPKAWAKVLYSCASLFREEDSRKDIIDFLIPVYFARVAAFVEETADLSDEEAEQKIEEQLALFRDLREYLDKRWEG